MADTGDAPSTPGNGRRSADAETPAPQSGPEHVPDSAELTTPTPTRIQHDVMSPGSAEARKLAAQQRTREAARIRQQEHRARETDKDDLEAERDKQKRLAFENDLLQALASSKPAFLSGETCDDTDDESEDSSDSESDNPAEDDQADGDEARDARSWNPATVISVPSKIIIKDTDWGNSHRLYNDKNCVRQKHFHEIVGFKSARELNNWLRKDSEFQAIWKPLRNFIAIHTKTRLLDEVELATLATDDQRSGIRKYTHSAPGDREKWTDIKDWQVWAWLQVKDLMTSPEGRWHGRKYLSTVLDQRANFLLMRARQLDSAVHKQDNAAKVDNMRFDIQSALSNRKKTEPEIDETQQDEHVRAKAKRTKAALAAAQRAASKKETKDKLSDPKKAPKKSKKSTNDGNKQLAPGDVEKLLTDLAKAQYDIPEPMKQDLLKLSGYGWAQFVDTLTAEDWEAVAKNASYNAEIFKDGANPEGNKRDWTQMMQEAGQTKRGTLEYNSISSPDERFWQIYTIIMASTHNKNRVQNVEGQELCEFLMNAFGRGVTHAGRDKKFELRVGQTRTETQEAAQLRQKAINSMEGDFLNLAPAEKSTADQGMVDELLSNKLYERTDFKEACKELRIEVKGRRSTTQELRTPLMRNSMRLFWWQITGAAIMTKMLAVRLCRGVLLADRLGTGKTTTAAVTMLHDYENYLIKLHKIHADPNLTDDEKIEALETLGGYKPWLVVIPGTLIPQWVTELQRISKYFKIGIYHSDARSLKDKAGAKHVDAISKPMSYNHERLRPDYQHCKIILTTANTFTLRHGPAVTLLHREATYPDHNDGVTAPASFLQEAFAKWHVPWTQNPCCKDPVHRPAHDLAGVFTGACIDEVHSFRSEQAHNNVSIRLLDLEKLILMTATPMPGGPYSLGGYLALLQKEENINAFRSDPMRNPYEQGKKTTDNDRLAMISLEAYEKYVIRSTYKTATGLEAGNDSGDAESSRRRAANEGDDEDEGLEKLGHAQSGQCIIELFKLCMVRRGYSTFIPGQEETTRIGRSLPKIFRYHYSQPMDSKMQKIYEDNTRNFIRRIITIETRNLRGERHGLKQDVTQTNSNAQRAMSLASLSPPLVMMGVSLRHEAFSKKEFEQYIQTRNTNNENLLRIFDVARGARLPRQGKTLKRDKDGIVIKKSTDPDARESLEPFEPYHYRDDEHNITEVNHFAWAQEMMKKKPGNVHYDEHVYLLLEIMTCIQLNENKGPFGDRTCGREIITNYLDKEGNLPDPDTLHGRASLLSMFMDTSTRIANLMRIVADCVKAGEKLVIWVNYPFEQLIVLGLLRTAGVSAAAYLADLNAGKRAKLQLNFNTPIDWSKPRTADDVQFLVCNYSVGGVGLNLQDECHRTVLLMPAATYAASDQAIGRVYRIGQRFPVHVIELYTPDTHDYWMTDRNMKRSLAGIQANIDSESMRKQYVKDITPEEEAERRQAIRIRAITAKATASGKRKSKKQIKAEDEAKLFAYDDDRDEQQSKEGASRPDDTTDGVFDEDELMDQFFLIDEDKNIRHYSALTPEEIKTFTQATRADVLASIFCRQYGARIKVMADILKESIDESESNAHREAMGAVGEHNNKIPTNKIEEFVREHQYVPLRPIDLRYSYYSDVSKIDFKEIQLKLHAPVPGSGNVPKFKLSRQDPYRKDVKEAKMKKNAPATVPTSTTTTTTTTEGAAPDKPSPAHDSSSDSDRPIITKHKKRKTGPTSSTNVGSTAGPKSSKYKSAETIEDSDEDMPDPPFEPSRRWKFLFDQLKQLDPETAKLVMLTNPVSSEAELNRMVLAALESDELPSSDIPRATLASEPSPFLGAPNAPAGGDSFNRRGLWRTEPLPVGGSSSEADRPGLTPALGARPLGARPRPPSGLQIRGSLFDQNVQTRALQSTALHPARPRVPIVLPSSQTDAPAPLPSSSTFQDPKSIITEDTSSDAPPTLPAPGPESAGPKPTGAELAPTDAELASTLPAPGPAGAGLVPAGAGLAPSDSESELDDGLEYVILDDNNDAITKAPEQAEAMSGANYQFVVNRVYIPSLAQLKSTSMTIKRLRELDQKIKEATNGAYDAQLSDVKKYKTKPLILAAMTTLCENIRRDAINFFMHELAAGDDEDDTMDDNNDDPAEE